MSIWLNESHWDSSESSHFFGNRKIRDDFQQMTRDEKQSNGTPIMGVIAFERTTLNSSQKRAFSFCKFYSISKEFLFHYLILLKVQAITADQCDNVYWS